MNISRCVEEIRSRRLFEKQLSLFLINPDIRPRKGEVISPARIRHARASVVSCVLVFVACVVSPSHDLAFAKTVVVLQSSNITSYNRAVKAFQESLPSSQHVHQFSLAGDFKNSNSVISKIRGLAPDVVVAVGLKAVLVLNQGLPSVPSIFCMVLDPGKYHLPRSDMIGISLEIPFKDQMQSLQEVLPTVKRVGVLYNPEKTGRIVRAALPQAEALGVELVSREVSSEKDVPNSLRAIVQHIDALWLVPDSTVLTADSFNFLLKTTLDANIPVMGFSPDLVSKGALLSTHFSYEDVGKQAAQLAMKIAHGRRVKTGILYPPEPLRLAINLKTAHFLKITVPPNVLIRFHEMY
ncbi:MAG: ABC transporter substrate-binding protein [Nitrospirales bacterium]|nr:ABC transporter substrate-binding protein [Nitrospira sp.]MDR4501082.1 ABC transporter substrate-binding protein [Nitrospirales bacterium]